MPCPGSFHFSHKMLLLSISIGECVSMCVSFRRYTRRRLWSDRDQIWHTHADSSPNGSELNKNQPVLPKRVLGGQKFKNLE